MDPSKTFDHSIISKSNINIDDSQHSFISEQSNISQDKTTPENSNTINEVEVKTRSNAKKKSQLSNLLRQMSMNSSVKRKTTQVLQSICFEDFDVNFRQMHRIKDVDVMGGPESLQAIDFGKEGLPDIESASDTLAKILEQERAFKIEYKNEQHGLINYYMKDDYKQQLESLKQVNDSEDKLFISKSQNIQSILNSQENKFGLELGHLVSLKANDKDCVCEKEDCICLLKLQKEDRGAHSSIQIVQTIQGHLRKTYIIQKICSISKICKSSLKIFRIEKKDKSLKFQERIYLNESFDQEFHPSIFSYFQDKCFLYFFKIEKKNVKLMNYNLITNVLSQMETFEVTQDKLISVGFLQKSQNVTIIRAEQSSLSVQPRVPIVLFYSTKVISSIEFEIRDSFNPAKKIMEPKKLEKIDNISDQNPIKLIQIKSEFDLEMDCLQIDKFYFYYEYVNNQLKVHEFNRKKLRGQSHEYLEQINKSAGKQNNILKYYEQHKDTVIESTQLKSDKPFFENCIAIFNQDGQKAYVIQQNNKYYTIKTILSSVLIPLKREDAKDLNRVLASHFDDDQCQVVIPRHLNFMVSYSHTNHFLKVVKDGNVIDIEEDTISDDKLFKKFLTPVIGICHIDNQKGVIKFISKKTVKSDGRTFFRNKQALKIIYDSKELKFKISDVSDSFKAFQLVQENLVTVIKSRNQQTRPLISVQSEQSENDNHESKVHIVLEKAIFAHDDRSVRPIVLIRYDGAASIALFDFRDMDFSEESIKKKMPEKDPLQTILEIELSFFENVSASEVSKTNKFILVPSSELTFKFRKSDESYVKFYQNYQVFIQSKAWPNVIEIHEFEIKWRNSTDQMQKDKSRPDLASIRLIGKKVFMFELLQSQRKQHEDNDSQEVQFMPLLNSENKIQGTQIIIKDEIYQLAEGVYKYDQQAYTWLNSEIFQGERKAYLLEASITPLMMHYRKLFDHQEINQILNDTISVLGNSIQFDVTHILNRTKEQIDNTSGYGYFSPLQILNGRPTIYTCIKMPEKLEQCLQQLPDDDQKKVKFDCSIFEKFCQLDERLHSYFDIELQLIHNSKDSSLARGIDLKSILETMIELNQKHSLKILIKNIQGVGRIELAQKLMMSSFEDVTEDPNNQIPLISEFLRDKSRDGLDQTVNIETGLTDKRLKFYASGEPLQIQEARFQNISKKLKTNILDQILQSQQDSIDQNKSEEDYADQVKIKHTFIDFNPLILQRKKKWILMDKQEQILKGDDHEMTLRQVSHICKEILDQDGDIESKDVIKNIIDYIFETYSKKVMIVHFLLYMVFFFIPFTHQIHLDASKEDGQSSIKISLSSFVITQAYFFMLEILELMHDPADYFKDFNNMIEFPIALISLAYFILRMTHVDKNYYPNAEKPNIENEYYVTFILLNLVIVMSGIHKVLKFSKISLNFGILVQLLIDSFKEILTFTGFMFTLLAFTSYLYNLIGAEISNDDYPELQRVSYYFIQTFRNSLGDINAPVYQNWIDYKTQELDGEIIRRDTSAGLMIIVIWLLWGLNIVIGLIMLLNFLIAIVSQSYNVVISRKEFYRYQHRCDINKDCLIYLEFYSKQMPCLSNMKPFNCLIIQSEYNGDAMDQWVSMIKQIQITIKDQCTDVKDHTVSQTQKLERMITGNNHKIKSEIWENKREITNNQSQIQQIQDDQNTLLQSIDEKMTTMMSQFTNQVAFLSSEVEDLKNTSLSMYQEQNEKILQINRQYGRIVDNEESNSLTRFNKILGSSLVTGSQNKQQQPISYHQKIYGALVANKNEKTKKSKSLNKKNKDSSPIKTAAQRLKTLENKTKDDITEINKIKDSLMQKRYSKDTERQTISDASSSREDDEQNETEVMEEENDTVDQLGADIQ